MAGIWFWDWLLRYSSIPACAVAEKVVVVPLGGNTYETESPFIISASAFRKDGTYPGSSYYNLTGGYFQGAGTNPGCIMAPVYLPDQVTVNGLSAVVYDNDATLDILVRLYKTKSYPPLGASTQMTSVQTNGARASDQVLINLSVNEPQIDNENFNYTVVTCLASTDLRLYCYVAS